MPVEFIGFLGNHNSSEIIPRSGPVVDPDYIGTLAKGHEYAGFDRALLAFHADAPDPLVIGHHAAHVTERLGIFIAYRPGFIAPTVLARQFATLDQLSRGRVSFNVITGAEQKELGRDGNLVGDKDERYARTNEFLDVVRLEWTSRELFTYKGKYYQVENGFPLDPMGYCATNRRPRRSSFRQSPRGRLRSLDPLRRARRPRARL